MLYTLDQNGGCGRGAMAAGVSGDNDLGISVGPCKAFTDDELASVLCVECNGALRT